VRLPAEGTPVITVARDKLHASFIDLPVVRGTASSSARARTH
jgi:hypothetical protein